MNANTRLQHIKLNILNSKIRITLSRGSYHKDIDYVSTFHYHTDYEIHFIKSGSFFITIDNKDYLCRENSLFILPPRTYHIIRTHEPGTKICFQCRIIKSNENLLSFDDNEHLFNYSMPEADTFIGTLNEFNEKQSDANLLKIKSILTLMLLNINDKVTQNGIDQLEKCAFDTSTIDHVLDYIIANYYKNIRLCDVAEAVFLSERQLTRIIKEETGETFLKLLTKYRISKAKKLINESGCTLEEIGVAVGFSTYCGFWKSFCNSEGISPSEYKRRIEKETAINSRFHRF